jgi:hypothetical protein
MPNVIYNWDEKGFLIGLKRIVAANSIKDGRILGVTQDGSREFITLLACISAIGKALPPALIYKGASHDLQSSWVEDVKEEDEVYFASTESGWSCDNLGLDWLVRVFERHTKEEAGNRRRLLLVDGHSSHVNMAFLNKADELKILVMILPPHSTHRLQPLDVGLFQPLSTAYSRHLNDLIYESLSWCKMTKRNFWMIFKAAWEESFTVKNILSAFEKTGIHPFNPDRTLTIIQKKEEPKHAQELETPLTCREIRGVQREFQYRTPGKAERAAKRLGHIAYKLAAMLEVQYHITRGLHKALSLEKKRRQRGKRLNLLGEEAGGPIFFSPSKVQRAKALQQAKDVEAQQKKDMQAEKKAQQAAKKQQKELEKAERAVLRENRRKEAQEKKVQQAAEAQARKEQREALRAERQQAKEDKGAHKQLVIRRKSSKPLSPVKKTRVVVGTSRRGRAILQPHFLIE